MKRILFIFLLPGILHLANAAEPAPAPETTIMEALGDGEAFVYRVGWGIFFKAGEIAVSSRHQEVDGRPQLLVRVTTVSRGIIQRLFSYENHASSVIDAQTGRLLLLSEAGGQGKYQSHTETTFDYRKKQVTYKDLVHPDKTHVQPIPEGLALDLFSALIQTRKWKMNLGDHRNMLVYFDDAFYDLTITADHSEMVHTPLGTFSAIVLVPRMNGAPSGLFQRDGQVRVWVSQDERQLPVKMEVRIKAGTVTAYLAAYQPPVDKLYANTRP